MGLRWYSTSTFDTIIRTIQALGFPQQDRLESDVVNLGDYVARVIWLGMCDITQSGDI